MEPLLTYSKANLREQGMDIEKEHGEWELLPYGDILLHYHISLD